MKSFIKERTVSAPYSYRTSVYSDQSRFVSPMHIHSDIEIIYLRSEMLEVNLLDNTHFVMNSGDIVVFRGEFPHETIGHQNSRMTCFRFSQEYYMKTFSFDQTRSHTACKTQDYRYLPDGSPENLKLKKYIEIIDSNVDSYNLPDYIHGAIQLTVALFKDINFISVIDDKLSSSKIGAVMDYIYANAEFEITLTQLADKFNYNKSYLSRMVKKTTGKTIFELVAYARLEKSKAMLIHTNKSITDIAISSGFSSSAYFIKIFRKTYSITPKTYRKLYNSSLVIIDTVKKI